MKRFFSAIALLAAAALHGQVVLTGTTGVIGPFTVQAGGCLTTTATVTGATTSGMTVSVAPQAGSNPGTGIYMYGYVSAANTVTVFVCNPIAGPIAAASYTLNVLTGMGGGGGGSVTDVTATAPITSSGGSAPNISATYQGNGAKVQASTGMTTTNDCVKFDANGNTVDAGAACATGTVTSVTATAPITSSGGSTPVISATYQGNGAKVQASTGTTTTNDCVQFDANGNTVDAGAPCAAPADTGAMIKNTGGFSVPGNTDSLLTMSTVVRDNGGFSGGSCGGNANTCLTVPSGKAGWYIITSNFQLTSSGYSGNQFQCNVSISGTQSLLFQTTNSSTSAFEPAFGTSIVVYLFATDYVQLLAYNPSTPSQTLNPITLSMARIN